MDFGPAWAGLCGERLIQTEGFGIDSLEIMNFAIQEQGGGPRFSQGQSAEES